MKKLKRIAVIVCLVFLGAFFVYQCVLAQGIWREKIRERIRNNRRQRTEQKQERGMGPGDYDFSLQHDGLTRSYKVHVPGSYEWSAPAPLVLAFHGGGGSSQIMANDKYYNLISKSDSAGFIVVFPNGVSKLKSGKLATWNAGNCCAYAVESQSDDVGFVRGIINDIENKFSIDPERIFATGLSNGGMLSYRLACEMADTFKAIAAVAGTDNYDNCRPQAPISIMHIHARDDDHLLFEGGCGPECQLERETEFTSVADTISKWVNRNHCDKTPVRVMQKQGVYCDLYTGCDGNVQVKLCVTESGGHSWPGGQRPRPKASIPSNAISATDEIWNFFSSLTAE